MRRPQPEPQAGVGAVWRRTVEYAAVSPACGCQGGTWGGTGGWCRLAAVVILGCVLVVGVVRAGDSASLVLRSSSGQFVVSAVEGVSRPPGSGLTALAPGTLLLTCERVRQALMAELRPADSWQGRIYVVVNPGLANDHPPVIGAQSFADGWQYRMDLPAAIRAEQLVRGLVQVLLLEVANRNLPARSAVVPLWLSEGLTQLLLHSALVDLVVEPPAASDQLVPARLTAWQRVRPDPMGVSRARLRTHAALSVGRMAEIGGDQVAEETWKTFQASAHVFMAYLLQLPQARPGVDAFLRQLPHHLNWQTAFHHVFGSVFPRLIDVEKWWSVVLVDFTGLDPMNAWSRELALRKLDDALHPAVLVADRRDRLPRRHRVSIQQILTDWELVGQRLLLQQVVNELTLLSVKLPPELLELAEAYRGAISSFLEKRRDLAGARARIGLPDTGADRLVRTAVEALDALDQRRAAEAGAGATVQESAPASQ